jgi:hypothetical protein
MRTRSALAALTALAISTPGMAAVDVRVSGPSVDILATNAPLSEVLDRLSRQTQMRVVYDGAPPRQTITLDLRGRTPVEAVTAALEGQGVNYALVMDPTGTRVETLLVSGTASTVARSAGASEDRRAFREQPPEPVMEEPEPAPEEEGPPADTTAGASIAGQSGKEAPAPAEAQPTAPPDAGLGGFTASPFAPTASRQPPPKPEATPPPFNP